MNIGIDIDDTITNTYDVMNEYARKYTIEQLGRTKVYQAEDVIDHQHCKLLYNWNLEEETNFFDSYYETIVNEVTPKEMAVEIINELAKENAIFFITARFESSKFDIQKVTKKWLDTYEINYHRLILNSQNKKQIAVDNNIEIFIDDSYFQCKSVMEAGIKTYMMDSNTNKKIQDDKITKICSWKEFYQEIENRR